LLISVPPACASVACPPPLPLTKAEASLAIYPALYLAETAFETAVTIDNLSLFFEI